MEQKKKEKQVKSNVLNKTRVKKQVTSKPINWYLVNAQGSILGKVAAKVASILLDKNDPKRKSYEIPQSRVVIINAGKVEVSGRKEENKKYYRYSGYPSGLRERTLAQLRSQKPEEIINHAVFGMLPKNRMGKSLRRHLFIYSGSSHPHEAQKFETLEV
ncbi:MAG: 50S ribosomal protein L13 [bacterium]|nr:50S ribosomal protein L13 [bacterium]